MAELKSEPVTRTDLQDWMMEHGEDVICDGPFDMFLTEEDVQIFCDTINANKKLLKYLEIDKCEGLYHCNVSNDSKESDLQLELFAQFLTSLGFTVEETDDEEFDAMLFDDESKYFAFKGEPI